MMDQPPQPSPAAPAGDSPKTVDAAPTPREVIVRALRLIRRSFRFWPVFLGAAAVAAVAVVLVPKLIPPVYQSKTVLLYRELIRTTSLLGRDAPVESQRQRGSRLREMLLSRGNFEKIINEYQLYPDVVESRGMIEAVEEFRKKATCKVGEDTFSLQYEGQDAGVVFNVIKRLGESLAEQSAQYRSEQAESTTGFLEEQRAKTKKELDDKEQELARFLAVHPEFAQDVMNPGGATTAGASVRAQQRKVQGLDPAIQALQRQRARLAKRLDAPDTPAPPPPPVDPQLAAALNRAQQGNAQAQQALQAARSRFTDKHPDVAAAQRRAASAKAALDAAKAQADAARPGPAKAPVKVDRKRLNSELARLNENLAKVKKLRKRGGRKAEEVKKTGNLIVDLETEWGSLNRDANEVRDRYQQIRRRLFQANIVAKVEASGGAAQMVVIDPAFKPERPVRLGSRRVGASAALVVMLLGAMIALGFAYFDNRVYEEDDVRRLMLGGVVHSVPAAKRGGGSKASG